MTKALVLAVLTGSVLVLPASAHHWGTGSPPYKVDAGFKIWFNIQPVGPQPNLAPWYLYYPYEAHFQTPSPWGSFSGSNSYWPMATAPAPVPTAQPQPQPTIRPTSYYYSPAPSYWYGR